MAQPSLPHWHPDADYTDCPFFIRKMDTRGQVKAAQVPQASLPVIGFLFLLEGEALVEAGGNSFVLSAGHLLLIPPDYPFSIHFYADAVGYSGGFSTALVPDAGVVRTLREPVHQAFWFDEGSFVGELFRMFLISWGKGDRIFIEKGLELLLSRIDGGKAPSLPPLVSAFMDRLFRPGSIPADISTYAADLHISGNYLSRIVKNATGRSVGVWIDIARVSIAKRLLKETDLPVIDIAAQAGLDDQSYFARFFKRKTGFSPSGFRKMMQG